MFFVSSWSFQNGFLDYINRSELNKLEGLTVALQDIYVKDKNWDSLSKNRKAWRKLIEVQVFNPDLPRNNALLRSSPDEPGVKSRQFQRERIILFDKEKNIIVGSNRDIDQILYTPILLDNEIIGYLGIEKRLQLSHKLDRIFAEQQKKSYAWIALGSILISILIAFPFASQLIKPIQALLLGTEELAKGNYQTRVSVTSRDEIGLLSKSFNTMADNIEQHQRTQQQWLADISHELRTPLAVLKAEIEAILDGVRKSSHENIESLHQEINYINRLVEDLHELSKSDIHALELKKENFFLLPILEEVFDIFSQEIAEKNFSLNLKCDINISLNADKNRLTQVFINLLQNNCRYSQQNARISITVNHVLNNNIQINWEDNGPGVKTENLAKLFDRLYREDSSRSSYKEGSGLGLSICKGIIDNHGGTMLAYQSEQGGLGIKITLPKK
jgi:two-component system sensor histidine kinase BaeS